MQLVGVKCKGNHVVVLAYPSNAGFGFAKIYRLVTFRNPLFRNPTGYISIVSLWVGMARSSCKREIVVRYPCVNAQNNRLSAVQGWQFFFAVVPQNHV